MPIFWTKPTESGLGDRLTDILFVATYAKIMKTELVLTWTPYRGHELHATRLLDPSFRYLDTILDNVKKYIRFPSNVVVLPSLQILGLNITGWVTNPNLLEVVRSKYQTFDHAVGGTIAIEEFWRKFLQDKISFEQYQECFNSTAKEFGFCEEINNYLLTLPERFMSFHIRRGDKVRNEKTDGTYIHIVELNELNKITHKALQYFSDQYDFFFVCSDQDEKKAEFTECLLAKGKKLISIPSGLEKWQQTYYDIAVMTKSEINIASNRFSSFSRFPSLIGNHNFKSVFQIEEMNENR